MSDSGIWQRLDQVSEPVLRAHDQPERRVSRVEFRRHLDNADPAVIARRRQAMLRRLERAAGTTSK